MDSKIGVILQARTGSTRLPNKMVLPFHSNNGILFILLQRIKKVLGSDFQIIVATTSSSSDDIIEKIAVSLGVSVYRGSENDVLDRFIKTAETNGVSDIIRICADNPFLDMSSLVNLIDLFKVSNIDYLAYSTSENVPTIKTHFGFWAEAVKLVALKKVYQMTDERLYHEHVTNYIYTHENLFNIGLIQIPIDIERNDNIRLTLDTNIDFELQKDLYMHITENNIDLTIENIIKVLDANPSFYKIMKQEIIKNTK